MTDRTDITAAVAKLDGASKFLGRRDVKELPNILWSGETVDRIAQGQYEGRSGILVATSQRVLFVDKRLLGGVRLEDFPYRSITSVQMERGILMGSVTIFTAGTRAKISQVEKSAVQPIVEAIKDRLTSAQAPVAPGPAPTDDHIVRLERLAGLHRDGALSDEEFAAAKARILG